MSTKLVPTIAPVSGYILRNGVIIPDDGGPGEIVSEALFLPDGRLEPAVPSDLTRIVECGGRYGITMGEPKPLKADSPQYGNIIRVRWETQIIWSRVENLKEVKL